ncbi:MAG TPA: hypothetical protein PLW20_05945 [Paludibacteraceae bacterium]|nr:hypothetical protein [Paludibacteraceae bacterium]
MERKVQCLRNSSWLMEKTIDSSSLTLIGMTFSWIPAKPMPE